MEQEFKDRINLNTDLSNISKQICIKYKLGNIVSKYLTEKEQMKIARVILIE